MISNSRDDFNVAPGAGFPLAAILGVDSPFKERSLLVYPEIGI